MKKEFLKILLERKKVNPSEVVKELKINISNDELDVFVKSLYAKDMIILHEQHRSGSLPKYDRIVLTEKGAEIIKEMLKE